MIESLVKPDFSNSIAPMGLNLVFHYYFYKCYRPAGLN